MADLNDGLVAYYPFNGKANDESGNGNHDPLYGANPVVSRLGNSTKTVNIMSIFQAFHGSTLDPFIHE